MKRVKLDDKESRGEQEDEKSEEDEDEVTVLTWVRNQRKQKARPTWATSLILVVGSLFDVGEGFYRKCTRCVSVIKCREDVKQAGL